jgi:hypothetical protein
MDKVIDLGFVSKETKGSFGFAEPNNPLLGPP